MELKLQTKKFGEILYKIDEEDLHLIENHKIYASKPSKNKIYLLRDDKQWLHKLIMPNCPKGYVVDHINRDTLDNRRCNLRYVTRSINGFNTDNLKFSNNEILEILLSDSEQRKIAKKYNISQSLVSQIKTGKIYKHLFPDILRVKEPFKGKLLEADVRFILTSGFSNKELALKFDLNPITISEIKTGKLYPKYCTDIVR